MSTGTNNTAGGIGIGGYHVEGGGVLANVRDIRLSLMVAGPVRALRGPEFRRGQQGRGHMVYNPSERFIRAMRSSILTALGEGGGPVFGRRVPLRVEVAFYLRRPQSHFRDGTRDVNNLKQSHPHRELHVTSPNFDNLVKFVLDVFTGIAYYDASVVQAVCVTKEFDDVGDCSGHTHITITPLIITIN